MGAISLQMIDKKTSSDWWRKVVKHFVNVGDAFEIRCWKEEVDEILKEDPTFVEPENIHTTTSINNITYDAYKVRDNKDLQYYLI